MKTKPSFLTLLACLACLLAGSALNLHAQTAPTITTQPLSQTNLAGSAVSFTVTANGTAPLAWQWLFNGDPLSDGGEISGSATASLLLTGITLNDAGNYSVIITNAYGSVTSSVAILNVPTCEAAPAGLVDWWPAESNANDIAGANNGTLVGGVTFTNGEVGRAFNFDGSSGYVSVSNNPLWNFGTNDFTIEFWANFNSTGGTQAFIANDNGGGSQNKWIFFYGYGVNGLTFHLNGTPGNQTIGNFPFAPVPGQWYHLAMTRGGTAWTFYVNGAPIGTDTKTFTVPIMTAPLTIGNAEGGFYFNGLLDEVSIYNRALSATEVQAIYNAGAAGKCDTLPPVLVQQPRPATILAGTSVSLSVLAAGTPPLGFQWLLNGTPLVDGGEVSGSATTNLLLSSTTTSDTGGYTVIITNNYGSVTSQVATITVPPASIISQPASQTVLAGSSPALSVVAVGSGPLGYLWFFNGTNLVQSGTNNTLSLPLITDNESGNYTVVISNSFGSVTSQVATLTVLPASIISQPVSQMVPAGSSLALSVVAVGAGPLGYLWFFNGTNLVQTGTSSTLTLNNVTTNNSGNYMVVITNSYGSVTSQVAALTVGFPPTVTTQPVSQASLLGTAVSFNVSVGGTGPFNYQWEFNGTNLPNRIITTVAGNGTNNYSGDGGAATNASLSYPKGVVLDASGNLYI